MEFRDEFEGLQFSYLRFQDSEFRDWREGLQFRELGFEDLELRDYRGRDLSRAAPRCTALPPERRTTGYEPFDS